MKINNEPLYVQLIEEMIEKIETKEWAFNSKIPSERDLSVMFSVSRSTIRMAIQELKSRGLVYQKKGSGTYISDQFQNNLVDFYSFTDEMKKQGKTPSTIILDFSQREAGKFIAKKLEIEPKEHVYIMRRLRQGDSIPMMYETTYIPVSKMQDLTQEMVSSSPLYDIIRLQYGIIISYALESFKPAIIEKEDAMLLECKVGSPAMIITRLTHCQKGIIEYTESIARGDLFNYEVKLYAKTQEVNS